MKYSFDFSKPDVVVVSVEAIASPLDVSAKLMDAQERVLESLGCACNASGFEITIPVGRVNWLTQRICLTVGDAVIYPTPDFTFQLDKQHDVHYMNRNFFSPATRISDPNKFCEFARSVLGVMEQSGRFYCGVLSVLGYRVSEDPTRYAELGNWLINKRVELLSVRKNPTNPLWLRWWISSAQTVACLAIYYKRVDAAISIAEDAVKFSRFGYVNHMIYWNMASIMLIYGFVLHKRDRVEEACGVFGELFDLCENGLRDIFNPRNNALVTQHTDCIALIEIGRQAYVCHFVCREGVIPLESKFERPLYLESFYIDFVSAVKRFPEKFRPALTELMHAKVGLNERLVKVLGSV